MIQGDFAHPAKIQLGVAGVIKDKGNATVTAGDDCFVGINRAVRGKHALGSIRCHGLDRAGYNHYLTNRLP